MKVRDYLTLVKWLDKSGDNRLSEFCIVVDFGAFNPSAMMLGGRIEGTITYEIRHDYIPAKDGDDA